MTTRFFVGRVFRIALAGSIGSILHVVGRCRIGLLSELIECFSLLGQLFECFTLLSELFECFSLLGERPIAFGLLVPPELSDAGPAIALIGESQLPPPGGRETFW